MLRHLSFRALLSFFLLALAGCPPRPHGGGVEDPSLKDKLGEGQCREVPTHATPLIMDWRSDQRAELEAAMSDGVVAVKYDCKTIELVRGCSVNGSYGFVGVQKKEDILQLADADEIRANLPTFGAKLSGELVRGSALDFAFVTVGKRRTLASSLARADFPSDACRSATHFVRGAYVGAFAMKEGRAGHVSAAAEVFGYGVSGKSSSSRVRSVKDGDPKACGAAQSDNTLPPSSCASLLRLELVAIGTDTKLPDAEVSGCPQGLALVQGKCTRASAGAFQCDPTKPDECRAQCEKGDAASCGFYAYALHYAFHGAIKDPAKARDYYQRACDKGAMQACAGLGIMHQRGEGGAAKDIGKAVEFARKACEGGSGRGCSNLGVSYENGNGVAKDGPRALKLYERACAAGFAVGCQNVGMSYLNGMGVAKNPARAKTLFEQACSVGEPTGCLRLAELYLWGREVPQDQAQAATLFRKACETARTIETNEACRQLAWAYVLGRGVAKDAQEGVRRFKAACDDNHGASCADLSSLHFSGEHVEKNELVGNSVLESACQRAVGDACSALGYAGLRVGDLPLCPAIELFARALDGERQLEDLLGAEARHGFVSLQGTARPRSQPGAGAQAGGPSSLSPIAIMQACHAFSATGVESLDMRGAAGADALSPALGICARRFAEALEARKGCREVTAARLP